MLRGNARDVVFEHEKRLVAVYDTEEHARAALRALERSGVDIHQARIGDRRDHLAAVNSEMRSETIHAGAGMVGPFTKPMAEGSVIGILVGALIGLVLALPFAAIDFGDMVLWSRLLVMAIVGIVFGGAIGWMIGGAFASNRSEEPLAAERGVTVALPETEVAKQAIVTTGAERVDVVSPGASGVSVVQEGHETPKDVVHDITRHLHNESRAD